MVLAGLMLASVVYVRPCIFLGKTDHYVNWLNLGRSDEGCAVLSFHGLSWPFTTGSHGMTPAVVSHERIVAPNGAGFMIYAQSLRRLKLPASFQPLATVGNSEYHVDASPLAKPVLLFDPQLLNLCPQSESKKKATLDDTAPEDPEMSRLFDRPFAQRVPDVSATRGLDSFQDLRLALHETVSSCPHQSGAA